MDDQKIEMLTEWRVAAGLKANEADRLLGLPRGSIKRFETLGIGKIPFPLLAKIIQAYCLSANDVLPVLMRRRTPVPYEG